MSTNGTEECRHIVSASVDGGLARRLAELAQAGDRTLSQEIRRGLRAHVERHAAGETEAPTQPEAAS